MVKNLSTLLLLIALLLLARPRVAYSQEVKQLNQSQPIELTGATSEAYKSVSGENLYIYRFDPEGHDPKNDTRPAVVFFFGGGWKGGSVNQFVPQATYLAQRGMVTFVADYRVKSRQKVSPNACVEDAKSAIRWVRKNAGRLGINPDEVIAGGGSAGGHIAAAAGICEGFETAKEDLSISSKPAALLLFNPVYDNSQKGGYGFARIKKWFPAISPAHNITADDPPAIVFLGTKDNLIPVSIAESFRDKMIEHGIQTELHLYEGKAHGFFNPEKAGFNDTLAKTDQFLVKLGYLSGPVNHKRIAELNAKPKKQTQRKQKKAQPANQGDARTATPKKDKAAQLTLASPFTDNAVLQRDSPVPVWGTAAAGTTVTVEFAGQKKSAVTNSNGKWKLLLTPISANAQPRVLKVSNSVAQVSLSNVVVGEVWICSGQSNMQMSVASVRDVEALISKAKNIRSFEVERTVAMTEQERLQGKWVETHPNSAVAFSFAHFLEQSADVPVGIILTCWGSSSIEAWMPRDMTESVPHFKTILNEFDADIKTRDRINSILNGPIPWGRKDDVFLRRQPNILYNAMLHPLVPYACRGLVWYQGERNTQSMLGMLKTPWFSRNSGMLKYGGTLNAWIERCRQSWNSPQMHFMTVMLPGYGKLLDTTPTAEVDHPTAHSWAWIRESQLKSLELQHTSVANTIDLGDVKNVHPKDKLPIGKRLALLATRNTLDQDIEAYGPMIKRAKPQGAKLVVHFDHAQGLKTLAGEAPTAFWLADDSEKWFRANAEISGQTVILSSPDLKTPRYVRYAFTGKPTVNLINAAGLPAYPFRTDTFKP